MIRILHIFIFTFWSTGMMAQKLVHIKSIQRKADSLVVSFWGQNTFDKYIHIDKNRSQYLVFGHMWEKECRFSSKLTFTPNTYYFKYNVIHPNFRGDTAKIVFYLDSIGNLMVGFNTIGFFQGGDLDKMKSLTKEQAILKARDLGLEKGIGNWTVSLAWKETDPMTLHLKANSTLKDYIQGHFTWEVKSTLNKSYMNGCYYYNKRVYSIDIFSGELISISEIGE